jgi:uncharacterized repeat protein (TIGR03803 family)
MIRSDTLRRALITKTWQRDATNALQLVILLVLPVILAAAPCAQAQTFTVLHRFTGGRDGAEPPTGVLPDAAGNLYGVTQFGGSFGYGTVFGLDTGGKETVLHSFLGGEGLWPIGGLIEDAVGNLYGTTSNGGTKEGGKCEHGCGTVFTLDKTGKQTVVYAFTGGADGGEPNATLIRDEGGNLFGTTSRGGSSSGYCQYVGGCGVIFELNKAGKETVRYTFTDLIDGGFPDGIVGDGAGNFYGTTYDGGSAGKGVVYKLDRTGKLTLLYSFKGESDSGDPKGIFLRDESGSLYGTTYGVGTQDYGVVFKLDTAGKLTVLYSFKGGTDGRYPDTLISDHAGSLYGTALGGGTGSGCYYGGCGTVFKLDTKNKLTVLHSFKGSDGQLPIGLAMDRAGNLYGTALGGGKGSNQCSYYHGCGTVFRLSP